MGERGRKTTALVGLTAGGGGAVVVAWDFGETAAGGEAVERRRVERDRERERSGDEIGRAHV